MQNHDRRKTHSKTGDEDGDTTFVRSDVVDAIITETDDFWDCFLFCDYEIIYMFDLCFIVCFGMYICYIILVNYACI